MELVSKAIQENEVESRPSVLTAAILWLSVVAGFTLSFMDLLEICTDACSDTGKFTIYSLNFGWFGVVFFATVLIVLAVRNRVRYAEICLTLLVFGAVGAELRFIWLQKYMIGTWCPICLAIASAVFVSGGTLTYERLRGHTMKRNFKRFIIMIVALVFGAAIATLGVAKESQAALDFFLGNQKSPVTVYFISDWFCPACRKVEPRLESIYAQIAKTTRIAFIDYPIHRETTNFTPYNLEFLAFEKDKYPKLRAALAELAKKTKAPTAEQVQAAVSPHGVKLRQINYADILYGLQANLTTYRGFGVKSTPTVVVENAKTRKYKLLVGDKQITLPAVQAAMAEVVK